MQRQKWSQGSFCRLVDRVVGGGVWRTTCPILMLFHWWQMVRLGFRCFVADLGVSTQSRKNKKLQPHRGAPLVRVVSIRWSVWIYTPPNFHLHTGVASSNAFIASLMMVSTLSDSQTDYFGLGISSVMGEERFQTPEFDRALVGRIEAMGCG